MSDGPLTLYQKIWRSHAIEQLNERDWLIAIDRHLVNEVTSPQAFEALEIAGRSVRSPQSTLAVADHNVPTTNRHLPIADPESRQQVEALERNVARFGVPYVPLASADQGIVHVIGPELGLTLPGLTIVCGDSHTSTHGAFGALAFGIGTSEVEHVLATQTLVQQPSKSMLVAVDGELPRDVTAKDLILAIIGRIGTAGATGFVIEYAGRAIEQLDMAGRMTVCNMSIEAGARAGLIAPDETTFAYLSGRRFAPRGEGWLRALEYWRSLPGDPDAVYDRTVRIDAAQVRPMVTWGTTPECVTAIDGRVPDPGDYAEPGQREQVARMLEYMDLRPGQPIEGLAIDTVFIGSCTNSRLEDLRAAAAIVDGQQVASGVQALVVPGSGAIKHAAEQEGLDRVFLRAGFEWREAGCSMCLGMNPDRLSPGQRCASTSNRNFEGRQGRGGRTHLMSPAMAAATALAGRISRPGGEG
ncbi:3-isopropylmalate dehydratase large subunit [Pelagerythrobacter sp.]|uniref:3-isopropylmalate dehydratase large subunit n=1 Tax=Pelagerythrobacter sp. TaxID=2800702 RepID=UPI0035B2637F